jgi:hypothetical protein
MTRPHLLPSGAVTVIAQSIHWQGPFFQQETQFSTSAWQWFM